MFEKARINIKRILCSHSKSHKVIMETTPPIVMYKCKDCGIVYALDEYKNAFNKAVDYFKD